MASPIKFAHVVFRTSRFDEMIQWWTTVLEATPRFANNFIAFNSGHCAVLDHQPRHDAVGVLPRPRWQPG